MRFGRLQRGALRLGLALFGLSGVACGDRVDASLLAPAPRQARVALIPALDLGELSRDQRNRLVVEEVTVSLETLRLLGAHPGIPAGGEPLLKDARVLSSLDEEAVFPFPEPYLVGELAVFGRLAPSQALDGASVVVRGRWLPETPAAEPAQSQSGLTQRDVPADPGPDGEPAKDPCDPGPDGEPARPHKGLGGPKEPHDPGPDREPAWPNCPENTHCSHRGITSQAGSVPFELRGSDSVDLLVDLSESSQLTVVLGVPAHRWLDATAFERLAQPATSLEPVSQTGISPRGRVVVDATPAALPSEPLPTPAELDGYRLVDESELDPARFRW